MRTLASLLLITAACAAPARTSVRPSGLAILDSSFTASVWTPMAESVAVYRVTFSRGANIDTITNVLEPFPIEIGSDSAAGIRLVRKSDSEGNRALFVFSKPTKTMKTWPLPDDVYYVYNDVVIAPNGRWYAYVGSDSATGGTYPVVRELASNRVVFKGEPTGGCDCDSDLNHARWLDADSVEIAVVHANSVGGWKVFAGRPSTGSFGSFRVENEPQWH